MESFLRNHRRGVHRNSLFSSLGALSDLQEGHPHKLGPQHFPPQPGQLLLCGRLQSIQKCLCSWWTPPSLGLKALPQLSIAIPQQSNNPVLHGMQVVNQSTKCWGAGALLGDSAVFCSLLEPLEIHGALKPPAPKPLKPPFSKARRNASPNPHAWLRFKAQHPS